MSHHLDDVKNLSDLDKLDYFDRDGDGKLIVDPTARIPKILDAHAHMGWSYAPGKKNRLDVTEGDDNVKLWYNYEKDDDLLYSEIHPTDTELSRLKKEMLWDS